MPDKITAILTAAAGQQVTIVLTLKTGWLIREQTTGWQDRTLAEVVAADPLMQEPASLGGVLREPVES